MIDTAQIFDLNEVNTRALLSPNVRSIHIYSGHIADNNKKAVLTLFIKRDDAGAWPAEQLAYIQRLKGNFTVVLKPSNEFFYISSFNATEPNLFNTMQGYQGNENILELVNRITTLQAENSDLKNTIAELKEQLENFETGSDKFVYALEKLFYQVAPKLGLSSFNNTQSMQGTNNTAVDWQTVQLSNELNEQNIEAALYVIYAAFGDEFVLKFAKRIQREPNLVTQLSMMI